MTILAPRDTTELNEMVRFAAGFDSGPLAVRYPRGAADADLPEARSPIVLGKCEVLEPVSDSKSEIAIIALGTMVGPAWAAAKMLLEVGVVATVVNARFVKPLDEETIVEVCKEAGAVLTVEENVAWGGFGERVREALGRNGGGAIPMTNL